MLVLDGLVLDELLLQVGRQKYELGLGGLLLLVDRRQAPKRRQNEPCADIVVAADSGERLSQSALAVQLFGNQ